MKENAAEAHTSMTVPCRLSPSGARAQHALAAVPQQPQPARLSALVVEEGLRHLEAAVDVLVEDQSSQDRKMVGTKTPVTEKTSDNMNSCLFISPQQSCWKR